MGASDEILYMFDTDSATQLATLEGHSDPVDLLTVDWTGMRALSVSGGNSVKMWELTSRECILNFRTDDRLKLLAVRVDWSKLTALATFDDGKSQLWDLGHTNSSAVKWSHAAPKFSNFSKHVKQVYLGP